MDESVQEKLLGNVDRTLTAHQQAMLDAPLSAKELQQAVYDLSENKSPGFDEFTAEFYKKGWSLLKDRYTVIVRTRPRLAYSKIPAFPLFYTRKMVTDDLKNYRPISLINLDLKTLTITLTNRLTNSPSVHPFHAKCSGL